MTTCQLCYGLPVWNKHCVILSFWLVCFAKVKTLIQLHVLFSHEVPWSETVFAVLVNFVLHFWILSCSLCCYVKNYKPFRWFFFSLLMLKITRGRSVSGAHTLDLGHHWCSIYTLGLFAGSFVSIMLQQQKALLSHQCDNRMMITCHCMMDLTSKGIVGVTFFKSLGIAVCVVSFLFILLNGAFLSVCCVYSILSVCLLKQQQSVRLKIKSATIAKCRL